MLKLTSDFMVSLFFSIADIYNVKEWLRFGESSSELADYTGVVHNSGEVALFSQTLEVDKNANHSFPLMSASIEFLEISLYLLKESLGCDSTTSRTFTEQVFFEDVTVTVNQGKTERIGRLAFHFLEPLFGIRRSLLQRFDKFMLAFNFTFFILKLLFQLAILCFQSSRLFHEVLEHVS